MKKINISKNIAYLRRKKGITQEQLAQALNISPQAVSKWETDTSLPDVQVLPLIADYFGVSIDYLYYGENRTYNDIYNSIFNKIAAHPQMSEQSFTDALTVFGYAHHGICRWNLKNRDVPFYNEPLHVSSEGGLSLLSGKGYGAIVTKDFFKSVNQDTAEFAGKVLPVLSKKNNFLVCLAIISMSDISFGEMKEKLGLNENTLRESLDELIAAGMVTEKKSKHKSLGLTYEIPDIYYLCLCILIATVEMQRYSLKGISCNLGYGDYPISF